MRLLLICQKWQLCNMHHLIHGTLSRQFIAVIGQRQPPKKHSYLQKSVGSSQGARSQPTNLGTAPLLWSSFSDHSWREFITCLI